MSIAKKGLKIDKITTSPGVYLFMNNKGEILYVGKAGNLRDRVRSYFNGHDERETVRRMLPQIEDIKIQKTDTVLEALILESHLIKKYLPKYNAMGKDDKSFAYFIITKEEFPRVLILRKTDLEASGVITSGDMNNNSYRSAAIPLQQSTKRTNNKSELKFGIATVVRGGLPRNDRSEVKKFYGPYTSKKQMEVALKILRKIFPFHSNNQKTEKGCLDFQIGRCPGPYEGAISKADYLKNIRGIRMILEGEKKSLVRKLEREMKTYAKNNEFEKAADARNKLFALKHIRDVALITDSSQLVVDSSQTIRVEAYDISNISGQHAVGSMAVFKNNESDKSQYRKFKIKTISGSDDVGMMREVLQRRFKNKWPMPDLILLDGGVGHLNMARKLISELGLSVDVVAVAKGLTRKNLKTIAHNPKPKSIKILNDKKLLKYIMDEAHRFAITYHRKLREKF
jgi:excinuclease ABC subunit C